MFPETKRKGGGWTGFRMILPMRGLPKYFIKAARPAGGEGRLPKKEEGTDCASLYLSSVIEAPRWLVLGAIEKEISKKEERARHPRGGLQADNARIHPGGFPEGGGCSPPSENSSRVRASLTLLPGSTITG